MDEKLGTQTKIETYIIISQSTVKSILDFAEEKNVNLIVVGTRGHSGIKKLLLGSTASGIVTYSSCPVIVVK